MDRYVIIMAGGRGERFWPLSREESPKQLLSLLGDRSFLQQCHDRVRNLVPDGNVLVVTNTRQRSGVMEQLPGLPAENIVAEPCGRDTCAAVTLGAALVRARSPRGVMAVLPADHLIGDVESFAGTLEDGFVLAEREEVIVTVGIEPTEPAIGYGYILRGAAHEGSFPRGTLFHHSERFVEKPDLPTAREYLQSGRHVWNAGMFLWSCDTIAGALRRHVPRMADALDRWSALSPAEVAPVLEREYPGLERISIDYALLEKAGNVVIATGNFPWDDLGTWTALARHLEADGEGNRVVGDLLPLDSGGNIVYDARSKRGTVGLVGVRDALVVLTDDAVLVADRGRAQEIKELVRLLAADERRRHLA